MKLKSVKSDKVPDYPSCGDYARKYRKYLGFAAAIGIGLSAGNLFAENASADSSKDKPVEEESSQKADLAALKLYASRLGDDDFKIRQDATIQLIALGKKKDDKGKTPLKEAVVKEMKKLLKSEDPEVSERAKKIIKALEVKTANNDNRRLPRLLGEVRQIR